LGKIERGRRDAATIIAESLKQLDSSWGQLDSRLRLVPGKQVLGAFRAHVKAEYQINLSDSLITSKFNRSELPEDLVDLLYALERYRKGTPAS
jgi:hypothetical protein